MSEVPLYGIYLCTVRRRNLRPGVFAGALRPTVSNTVDVGTITSLSVVCPLNAVDLTPWGRLMTYPGARDLKEAPIAPHAADLTCTYAS